jgi:hypothetical protein
MLKHQAHYMALWLYTLRSVARLKPGTGGVTKTRFFREHKAKTL